MIEHLRPDAIITGPLFPEPVKVVVVTPFGSNIKIFGVGQHTGQAYQPVLRPDQLAQLHV